MEKANNALICEGNIKFPCGTNYINQDKKYDLRVKCRYVLTYFQNSYEDRSSCKIISYHILYYALRCTIMQKLNMSKMLSFMQCKDIVTLTP